ncbi:hypothetical protein TNCV_2843571 [Trichonephila clavipes]|nr:hypothetical protein TNCV_2843571 [Trichonephila clavipes]
MPDRPKPLSVNCYSHSLKSSNNKTYIDFKNRESIFNDAETKDTELCSPTCYASICQMRHQHGDEFNLAASVKHPIIHLRLCT